MNNSSISESDTRNTSSVALPLQWPARKKYDNKSKLYMHYTSGDVALMNIRQETNYFHDFV